MEGLSGKKKDKKEALKTLIRSLHEGADPEAVKERFKEIIGSITPIEIAAVEEELIRAGMPQEEIRRLCDIHLAVFRETLEKEKALAPTGHPVHILMEEHKILLKFAGELKKVATPIKAAGNLESTGKEMEELDHILEHLKESESHYLREENVLFPYLEKHGVTQPPAIMWMEHDKIREIERNLYTHHESRQKMRFRDFADRLEEAAIALAEMLSSHFYKENNILFPTALKVIGENEWKDVRRQFDEIGYCCFTPESATITLEQAKPTALREESEGVVSFEIGSLSKEELEAALNTLPVDITFVDKDDTVRYFSQGKERTFVRTKAVIGRKVQQCHPQKSVHVVNRILEAFKNGSRDVAEFWIDLKGRLIYIRYFAVRGKSGEYLGCLEVTQDITNIKKIEGERRLLDWT